MDWRAIMHETGLDAAAARTLMRQCGAYRKVGRRVFVDRKDVERVLIDSQLAYPRSEA